MIKIYPAFEVTRCGNCPALATRSDRGMRCNMVLYEDWSFHFGYLSDIHPLCPLETKEEK
jgi:hypothetical protein